MDYIFVPNFMKIRRGQDFFVDLAWNDPSIDVSKPTTDRKINKNTLSYVLITSAYIPVIIFVGL